MPSCLVLVAVAACSRVLRDADRAWSVTLLRGAATSAGVLHCRTRFPRINTPPKRKVLPMCPERDVTCPRPLTLTILCVAVGLKSQNLRLPDALTFGQVGSNFLPSPASPKLFPAAFTCCRHSRGCFQPADKTPLRTSGAHAYRRHLELSAPCSHYAPAAVLALTVQGIVDQDGRIAAIGVQTLSCAGRADPRSSSETIGSRLSHIRTEHAVLARPLYAAHSGPSRIPVEVG